MAFAEDLSVFFAPDAPGVKPAYRNGATDPVYGEFQNGYFDPLGVVAEGTAPVFQTAHAWIPGVKQGDVLEIETATYKVRGVEPDGLGVVTLRLEKQ